MDSQKRLLLALGLSVALTSLFLLFNPPVPAPPSRPEGGAVPTETSPAPAPAAPIARAPQEPTPPPGPTATGPAEVKQLEHAEEDIQYRVSSKGAALVSASMKDPKMREQRRLSMIEGYKLLFGGEVADAPPIDMASAPAMFPPALAVGVRGAAPLDPWLVWRVDENATKENRVVLVGNQGPWEVRKTIEWVQSNDPSRPAGHGFDIAMTVALTNTSAQALQGELAVHYSRAVNPKNEEKPSWLGSVGNESKATCFVQGHLRHLVPDQGAPKPEDLQGPISFFGVDQQYFLGAVFPVEQARDGRCEIVAAPDGRAAVGLFPLLVQPGQTVTERFGVYVGPKDAQFLELEPTAEIAAALGAATRQDAQLDSTVNFGIWEVICVILLKILRFFHGIFGNWGLAIVFLTLTVKVALIPLSLKSMIAAENMKKLQPRMEEIRKKFEGDRERMNMEVMKLYQEAKVNPLGGCFPLLIQMPVWIALFTTLRNSFEIYREPFFGPVWTDLTYKDPTYILPVMLGVTMIITQRLQPAVMDKVQQRMMTWVMPIFFTALMLLYPAGLTLYIFTNNVLSIAQQYGLRKYIEKRRGAAPKAVAKRTA